MSKRTKQKRNVIILSTVSSGKSTLINSLIGKELMPSMNLACTSKLITVSINSRLKKEKAILYDGINNYKKISNCTLEEVVEFNNSNDFTRMDIESPMWSLKDMGKWICIDDTPGVNNALDYSHKEITIKRLNELERGFIVYLINACSIGTDDDYEFLRSVIAIVNKSKKIKIIFVVNKMDEVNRTIEEPKELLENVKVYIKNLGIDNPEIFPFSADASLLFRRALNGEKLSEVHSDRFYKYFKIFRERGYSLGKIAITNNRFNKDNYISVDDELYYKEDIYDALKNTGINLIEKEIQNYIKQ